MKICVIYDDESTTKTISKFLQMEGHECVATNDGQKGLYILEKEDFDAVVLDLAMPDFGGMDIVAKLEDTGRINEHKICVLTASSSGDDDYNYLKNKGVKEILKKPLVLSELLKILEKMQKS